MHPFLTSTDVVHIKYQQFVDTHLDGVTNRGSDTTRVFSLRGIGLITATSNRTIVIDLNYNGHAIAG